MSRLHTLFLTLVAASLLSLPVSAQVDAIHSDAKAKMIAPQPEAPGINEAAKPDYISPDVKKITPKNQTSKFDNKMDSANPAQDASGIKGHKGGFGSPKNDLSGTASDIKKTGNCPKGFVYVAGSGCGPKPGFCPQGFAAQAKGAGMVCRWQETQGNVPPEREVCPRGYHRSGDTCISG